MNTNKTALAESNDCINDLFSVENKLFDFHKYISGESSQFFDLFKNTYFKNACSILNET
jgi:hypothetical protein